MKTTKSKTNCPRCPSHDAYTEWEDGHGKCFSCGYAKPANKKEDVLDNTDVTFQYLPWRGISEATFRVYQVGTAVRPDGSPRSVGFIYPNGAKKTRLIEAKEFYMSGSASEAQIFGANFFPSGSQRQIIITEGELDALSVYDMLGSQYPAVSVRSSSSAAKDCAAFHQYLDGFKRIYLCFDNDEPGQKAAAAVAALFDFNKVYVVKMEKHKDANEYLQAKHQDAFRSEFYAARRYLPTGVVSSLAEFSKLLDEAENKPSVAWPFPKLQEMTYGIRTGEVVLVTAQEGVGKTEFIRTVEHHLLKTTDAAIATIHLEETPAEQLKRMAGLELGVEAHLPDSNVSKEEILKALGEVGGNDRLHLYTHAGTDDPNVLLASIRHLVAGAGCKYVFLDHITMMVTGMETDDERRVLDYLSTRLRNMVVDLDFCLFLVSHINDNGQTRGSRNIGKIANIRIDLNRDIIADLEEDRMKTFVTVSKNRFGRKAGPGGILRYDEATARLKPYNPNDVPPVPVE